MSYTSNPREKVFPVLKIDLIVDYNESHVFCQSYYIFITPWHTEPGGWMPHSEVPSNNPLIPRNDTYLFKVHSNIVIPSTPRPSWRPLPVRMLKAFLPSSILARWPAPLNLLDSITLTTIVNCKNYEVLHCGAFFTSVRIPIAPKY